MNTSSMIKALVSGLMGAALLAATAAQAQSSRPSYVRVRGISHAGTGCPAGSVAVNISPDREAATFLFDEFVAEIGPGVPFSAKRKNCQISLDLAYPSGWQYEVVGMTHSGYVSLDRGITATQTVSLYFQGQSQTARLSTTMRGPMDQDYRIRDVLSSGSTVTSPCGVQRALNINTSVNLTSTSSSSWAQGLITVDKDPGDLPNGTGNLILKWSRCR